jgi:hypothetical protein
MSTKIGGGMSRSQNRQTDFPETRVICARSNKKGDPKCIQGQQKKISEIQHYEN